MSDVSMAGPSPNAEAGATLRELEQRMTRLEEAVAALCDTQLMEDRLTARITERLRAEARTGPAGPAPLPSGVGAQDDGENAVAAPLLVRRPSTRRSFFSDVWNDLVLLVRMWREPLYSRSPWNLLLAFFALVYLTVWTWLRDLLPGVPTIPLFTYVDELIVMYLGLKAISRELRQYEQYVAERELARQRSARSEH